MQTVGRGFVRRGRLGDLGALAGIYARRSAPDRAMFHPFADGRLVPRLVFFLMLSTQRFYRLFLRLYPRGVFAVVVHSWGEPPAVDGWVYLRVTGRRDGGYVANLGTQVDPSARGRGVGPQLIGQLLAEARKRRVRRIETEVYASNAASLRMCEKLGFRPIPGPEGRRVDEHGVALTLALDVPPADAHSPREA